jgi:hypothetical protein
MNDLVAQLLPEATIRIWNRLDNYLKEGVGKGEGTYNQIPTGSVNQLSLSQTAGVTIKPNGERNGSDSPKTILPQ